MSYDLLIIAAHPVDAEVQMGATLAKLTRAGQRALIVDLCDGEPADFAPPGTRREQAGRVTEIGAADLAGVVAEAGGTVHEAGSLLVDTSSP